MMNTTENQIIHTIRTCTGQLIVCNQSFQRGNRKQDFNRSHKWARGVGTVRGYHKTIKLTNQSNTLPYTVRSVKHLANNLRRVFSV
jgi:hypothetical protein